MSRIPATMAATNKCLARSNKSRTGGKAIRSEELYRPGNYLHPGVPEELRLRLTGVIKMKMPRSKYWLATIIVNLLATVLIVIFFATASVLVLLLLLPGVIYLWVVAFARLRDIGLVTWLAALLIVIRFALSLLMMIFLVPVWVVMEVIIWIALGFIPTGAATGRARLVEAPSS
jgi:hypothetical protein